MTDSKFLTVTQFAERANVSIPTVYSWVRKGWVNVRRKPSGRYDINEQELYRERKISSGGQNAS